MVMAKKEIAAASGAHNVLTPGTLIKGEIRAEEDFRIDGTIEGNIECKGKIIIGQSSTVIGNIKCGNLELWGKLEGNILCSGTVLLRVSGNLEGEIKTQVLEIENGAKFCGTCTMGNNKNKEDVVKK